MHELTEHVQNVGVGDRGHDRFGGFGGSVLYDVFVFEFFLGGLSSVWRCHLLDDINELPEHLEDVGVGDGGHDRAIDGDLPESIGGGSGRVGHRVETVAGSVGGFWWRT